jgi:transcriptional regulator with XRE-family HTH domain
MFISIEQIKAARALLKWNQKDLAEHAGLNDDQIQSYESGRTKSLEVLEAIFKTLTHHGIDFADGGVKPQQTRVITLSGAEGLRTFMNDVYETARTQGGEICLHNAKPSNWIKWLGEEWFAHHNKRMKEVKENIQFKITAKIGDTNLRGNAYAEYRWIPEKLWDEKSFYVYGDNIGFIDFDTNSVNVFILKQKSFANSFRSLFNAMWDNHTLETEQTKHDSEK